MYDNKKCCRTVTEILFTLERLDVDDHKIVIGLIYGKAYAIRAYVFLKKMKPAYNICRIN